MLIRGDGLKGGVIHFSVWSPVEQVSQVGGMGNTKITPLADVRGLHKA